MFKQISQLFKGSSPDLKSLLSGGAQVIDVRTTEEFKSGHLPRSINIPLDRIESKSTSLSKDQDLILVCRSGMRSSNAVHQLRSKGFTRVYNGGSWTSLQNL